MNLFNKITALLLLAIYLLSATATKELLRIPLLAEHYYDHKQENNNTGLIAFLAMHYYSEDGTDKDAKEDNQLPFKSVEYAATFYFISLTPPSFTEHLAKPETETDIYFAILSDLFLPSQYLASIWQPPRIC